MKMDSENFEESMSNEAQSDSFLEPHIISNRERHLEVQRFEKNHRNVLQLNLSEKVLHYNSFEKELYYDLSGKISVTLFVHQKYDRNRYEERKNAVKDLVNIKNCFRDVLKADFDDVWDATKETVYNKLDCIANLDPGEYSCIIIIVLTHGTSQKLAARDQDYDSSILREKLEGKFVGKPKLYFIQACRGKEIDEGMEVADSIGEMPDDEEVTIILPKMADFLQMHSTVDGYIAYRDNTGESYFMKALCEVFTKMYDKWDLLQMLTIVNKIVAQQDIIFRSKVVKEIPEIVSTLTKFLKFKTQENNEGKIAPN